MSLLKSLFITSYITFAYVASIFAASELFRTETYLTWIGVLLTNAPFALMIAYWMLLKSQARTSSNLTVLNVFGLIGTGIAAFQWVMEPTSNALLGLIISAIGWAGLLVYIYWYSRFNRTAKETTFKVGATLPNITLQTPDGESVSFEQLQSKPNILLFFRGNWCPLCMAQIKEMVEYYNQLEKMGVRIALISPQSQSHTQALAAKFDVAFEFYSDPENAAARRLGIDAPNGLPMGMQAMGYDSETVLPTVIITDAENKVLWTHETDNYRVRPDPDVYLQILQQHNIG